MTYETIALLGEAGSGKDYIVRELMKISGDNFNKVVTATSRPPREGEINGINYIYYPDNDSFIENANNFIEYTSFNNWYYGTPITSFDKDKINIVIVNPAGLKAYRNDKRINLIKAYWVRTLPTTRLIRQLKREKNPDIKEIFRRYNADKKDFDPLIEDEELISIWNENDNNAVATILQDIQSYYKILGKSC